MGRPKGSKDQTKRKQKTFMSGPTERSIVEDCNGGMSGPEIMDKYNISKSQLLTIKKNRNIKRKINHSDVVQWEEVGDFSLIKNISGVYAIYFIWKYNMEDSGAGYKINDIMTYIGSSVDIGTRLAAHGNELKQNKHYNKKLQAKYNDTEFCVKYAIIERCDVDQIMPKERGYLNRWSDKCLLNSWKAVNEEDINSWLQKAVSMDTYKTNFKWSSARFHNGTPCKESNCVHKSGYARMCVALDTGKKYLYKHRVAYWEKYGEYVELVRHMCDNPKCYNPDHLAEGNHRDNNLDRRGDFPKEFEKKWLEFDGDLFSISKYYESLGRWKPNQLWCGKRVSYGVYAWEKKLGLKEKYPEVVRARISKLRKKQAQRRA